MSERKHGRNKTRLKAKDLPYYSGIQKSSYKRKPKTPQMSLFTKKIHA